MAAGTYTTNYSLYKPADGEAGNIWAPLINTNFDTIDSTLASIAATAAATPTAIEEQSSNVDIKCAKINIGVWNMDATGTVQVAHGITYTSVAGVMVTIIDDAEVNSIPIATGGTVDSIDATNITISRTAAGTFDSANFDSTGINRGFIFIWYVE